MRKTLLIILLFLSACSSGTVYNIEVDLLSFLDDYSIEQSIIFPDSPELNIFLFPGVELDLQNSGPGLDSQQGIIVGFPSQDINNLNTISVKLEIGAEITNLSLTEQITGDRISLFFAADDTENIYTEGIRLDLFNVDLIPPEQSAVFSQVYYFEENSLLLQVLRSGIVRLGLGIYLTASSASVPVHYRLDRISLSSGVKPLQIIIWNDI